MAREQMAEGEAVRAVAQRRGMRQKLPLVDLGCLSTAVGAVWGDGLLC